MFEPATQTVTRVAHGGPGDDCASFDSVRDDDPKSARTQHGSTDKVIGCVTGHGLKAQRMLETHAPANHLSAAPHLRAPLRGKIGIGDNLTAAQTVL